MNIVPNLLDLKHNTWLSCKNILLERIESAEKAMKEAQTAANSEEKSSVGDKYETSRAMGQLARDMNAKQLAQGFDDYKKIQSINIQETFDSVQFGSFVKTNIALYFVAIGLGKIRVDDEDVFAISPSSPLGIQLLGKSIGSSINFLNNVHKIEAIY